MIFLITTRTQIIIACAAVAIAILAVAYVESIPGQIPGTSISDRTRTLYFAVKNAAFSEPVGIEGYVELKKHSIYQKFKSMYPNSTDDFGVAIDGSVVLTVSQYDNDGNKLRLTMRYDDRSPFPFNIGVGCVGGAYPFQVPSPGDAFAYLDNQKCLLD